MLKERTEFVRRILYVVDLLIVTACFFFSYYLFSHSNQFFLFDDPSGTPLFPIPHSVDLYLRAYWLVLVLWAVILQGKEGYQLRVQTYAKVIGRYFSNGLIFFGLLTSLAFLFKMEFMSRVFIVFYTAISVIAMLVNRFFVLSVAYYFRSRGYNYRSLLLVGTGKRAQDFINLTHKHKEWGYRIIGLLDQQADKVGQLIGGYPVMGVLSDLPKLLEKNVVDEIVFVVPRNWLKEIEQSILYCEAVGVPATLSTNFFDLEIARGAPQEMDGNTFLTFATRQLRDPELLAKRTLDILFSSLLLAVTSPIFFATALAIKLDSKGPVFFKQVRCGRNGRKFMVYKFRSMVPGAEERLEELKGMNEMSGPVFKIEKDPRLTRLGKFLRKTSLDEFPQFWNVLKGDMSIVGPRPPIPSEVEKYEPWQRRRLSMKPGITCIWQVSGRNHIGFEQWMKMDLQYIDRWSLWLDFKIILQTIRVVITGHGAK